MFNICIRILSFQETERAREKILYIYMFIFIQMDSLLFMHYILHMNLLIACQTHTDIYVSSSFIFIYICNYMCSPKPPHWRKGLTSTITPTNWTWSATLPRPTMSSQQWFLINLASWASTTSFSRLARKHSAWRCTGWVAPAQKDRGGSAVSRNRIC